MSEFEIVARWQKIHDDLVEERNHALDEIEVLRAEKRRLERLVTSLTPDDERRVENFDDPTWTTLRIASESVSYWVDDGGYLSRRVVGGWLYLVATTSWWEVHASGVRVAHGTTSSLQGAKHHATRAASRVLHLALDVLARGRD